MSRVPLKVTDTAAQGEPQIFNLQDHDQPLPVQATEVAAATRKDPQLSRVLLCFRNGWPQQVSEELQPYARKRDELSIEGGCILWGTRVVLPRKLRARVLQELHRGHPGIVKMKQLARSYVWWSDMASQLEEMTKSCEACQSHKKSPQKVPLHTWPWPKTPWECVHVDFLGPSMGRMILVAVDAHSKWPEATVMTSTTAAKTISVLREMFARNGR